MGGELKTWQKWALAMPIAAALSLGATALPAGRFWWFTGHWANTVFVLLLLAWFGLSVVLRSAKDAVPSAERHLDAARFLFFLGFLAIIAVAVYDRTHGPAADGSAVWTALGLALCLVAAPLGIIAVYALGHLFAPDPTLLPARDLDNDQVYHYVRHPVYTALLLWALGLPLIVRSWWGFGVAVVFMVPGLYLRLSALEEKLLKTFGDEYRSYQARTWRVIPFIF